ncbi:MFS transporter [Rhizorhabdus wittichii]|uniref:MFS transporter n=1 Tax=Rhizorhabdus wittichii TaxID=160791 RepID=A0A975HC67_9SPHN|nr:MFS transporter [Rhizorhabdus wittichii]QTH20130.1 MFS transporter [Rhizorhabdus wittichii]
MIEKKSRMRHYVLVVLCLVSVVNYIDRQILTILLEPIKKDLAVSDTVMGMLTGTAFSICYVLASFPIARLADKGARRTVLAACLALWSSMTALSGLAQSTLQLALARAGVAIGEAGAVPASQSLLSDIYPSERRATVFGILTAASAVGAGAGLFIGGWISAHFDWRTAFFVVGLPGLVLALFIRFTVAEPPRGQDLITVAAASTSHRVARILWDDICFRWLAGICTITGLVTYGVLGWVPAFFMRVHGMGTEEVGLWVGLASVIGQGGGHVMAGLLADHLARRDVRWYAWFAGIGTALSAPAGALFVLSGDVRVAIGAFVLFQMFKSMWLAPTYSIAYRLLPARMRATISATLTSCIILAGLGLGPLLIGVLNDLLSPSLHENAVRFSILLVVALMLPAGGAYGIVARLVGRADAAGALVPRPV